MLQLQGDSVLGEASQKLISGDLHRTVIPTSELAANLEELSKTFILVLTYCPDILKYVVGPKIRVFNSFNIAKICELLAQLTIRDPSVSIFIKDWKQTLDFLGTQPILLSETQFFKNIAQLIESDKVVFVYICFNEKLKDVSILEEYVLSYLIVNFL